MVSLCSGSDHKGAKERTYTGTDTSLVKQLGTVVRGGTRPLQTAGGLRESSHRVVVLDSSVRHILQSGLGKENGKTGSGSGNFHVTGSSILVASTEAPKIMLIGPVP